MNSIVISIFIPTAHSSEIPELEIKQALQELLSERTHVLQDKIFVEIKNSFALKKQNSCLTSVVCHPDYEFIRNQPSGAFLFLKAITHELIPRLPKIEEFEASLFGSDIGYFEERE